MKGAPVRSEKNQTSLPPYAALRPPAGVTCEGKEGKQQEPEAKTVSTTVGMPGFPLDELEAITQVTGLDMGAGMAALY